MSEPNVIRYARASHERIETSPKLNPFNSPLIKLTTNSATAPISICIPVESSVDLGMSAPLAKIDPIDQNRGARSNKITPKVSNPPSAPVISAGPIRMNTPAKPTINPRMACQVGLVPPARMDSNSTSQNGEVVINKAAIPEGTVCSAQATSPFPPSRSAVPTIAVDLQWPAVGAGSPAARRHTYKIAPEIKKRKEACRNGGMVSTEKRIARYVEPQTIYSASKAIQTFVFIQIPFWFSRGVLRNRHLPDY